MVRLCIYIIYPIPLSTFTIRSTDAPSDDDLGGRHPLVELVHVLGELHVHGDLSVSTEGTMTRCVIKASVSGSTTFVFVTIYVQ